MRMHGNKNVVAAHRDAVHGVSAMEAVGDEMRSVLEAVTAAPAHADQVLKRQKKIHVKGRHATKQIKQLCRRRGCAAVNRGDAQGRGHEADNH